MFGPPAGGLGNSQHHRGRGWPLGINTRGASATSAARKVCSGPDWSKITAHYKAACAQDAALCSFCGQRIVYRRQWPHRTSFSVDHGVPLASGGNPLDPSGFRPSLLDGELPRLRFVLHYR